MMNKREINLTINAYMIVDMFIEEEAILFPVAAKHIFALNKYHKILKWL